MDKIELAGFTAEQTESIREAARKYAERTTFTVEEATEKILDALNFISGAIRAGSHAGGIHFAADSGIS